MPPGLITWALVAGPLSPLNPGVPFPAMVVITPLETLRILWSDVSAMYRLPAESMATPVGPFNWALVAGPLSPSGVPVKPYVPFPATVVITPLVRSEEHTSELQSLRHLVCRLLLD